MTPRALTEEEKCRQCDRLVEVGKSLIIRHGLDKISVDEVVQKAGMAKGSFYKHFETKELFLSRVVWDIYQDYLEQTRTFISQSDPAKLPDSLRIFIRQLFSRPETAFFFQAEKGLSEVFMKLPQEEKQDYASLEKESYRQLVLLIGADPARVNPSVVHNYLHTMYFLNSSDMMLSDAIQETFELMLESLIAYVFGGEK